MASGNFIPYDNFIKEVFSGALNYSTDNIQAMLLGNNYVPDRSSHKFLSDVVTYEVPATGGYARQVLSNKKVELLSPSGFTKITADNILFGENVTIRARYLVLFNATPTGTNAQQLMFYVDLNSGGTEAVQSANSTFALDISPNGIYQIDPIQ